ncbi:uncharacterized protein M421DRAFT_145850 [Didymella exigua CBS 183.55]|uniref:Uncharacterized protein n=1 Tax=Didymella exigua CBS 183.55 TaxID=1150837 RepID=A0A6A5RKW1_9PLEO|nr:uncharacterized protein M421DRAFT_145850 [Didymella exigua CBS 183.55]KAF1929071.1 hypothetical protein M421DRAFT_145850 [Didymella exigua CBS 183.55]
MAAPQRPARSWPRGIGAQLLSSLMSCAHSFCAVPLVVPPLLFALVVYFSKSGSHPCHLNCWLVTTITAHTMLRSLSRLNLTTRKASLTSSTPRDTRH